MPTELKTIQLPLPLGIGKVNCYLLRKGDAFTLIDTGGSNARRKLVSTLEGAGCAPGQLSAIVLTHGDFDHTGNAAYLRQRYGARVLMHKADLGMVEHGDMFSSRSIGNPLVGKLAAFLFGFPRRNWFSPDAYLQEGDALADYGLDLRVLSIPGHSLGSIGLLTSEGDLFCGDLIDSNGGPALNRIMDDAIAAEASVQKLRELVTGTVYPGHGPPFTMAQMPESDAA